MSETDLSAWITALHSPLSVKRVHALLQQFGGINELMAADEEALQARGVKSQEVLALKNPDRKLLDKTLQWASLSDQAIIPFSSPDYPRLLREIADPPLLLFVRGQVSALQSAQLAIVGSRHATSGGIQNAKQFAANLAAYGLTITSGLALGIDGAAHGGVLEVNGTTIGVCGSGLENIYPKQHESLVARIADSTGAVISEFPLATKPFAGNFPRRNRIIAGMSLGVIVVEAALKSGSLITARLSAEAGREVFAIPGSIHHPLARGCHYLIRQGAKLVETASDIVEELSALQAVSTQLEMNDKVLLNSYIDPVADKIVVNQDDNPTTKLSGSLLTVFGLIAHEITSIDMILLRSQLTVSEVSSILLELELNGYIQSVAGGYRRFLNSRW